MTQVRIDDYAFLSDCHAPALISRDGSVDWWCPPRVDGPSVFGRLLGQGAGHWLLQAEDVTHLDRRYVVDTLVLETIVTTSTGQAVIREGLAMQPGARGHELGRRSPHVLVREVKGVRGRVSMRTEVAPRFEYGLTVPHLRRDGRGVVAETAVGRLRLAGSVSLEGRDGALSSRFTVHAGAMEVMFAAYADASDVEGDHHRERTCLDHTVEAWQSWARAHPGYKGRYADKARRSALVLQGLTYQPSGAVMAAATTSLPAAFGGDANWDYRYAWLRDLSLTGQALWIAACPDEASRYLRFLADAAGEPATGSRIQIMYGVDGRRHLPEHILEHLEGFRGSGPVRVGNAAWDQAQLDVMGEVLDLACRFADQLEPLDQRSQTLLRWLADEAADTWASPDAGMWEARDAQRQYLTSKVMCWVALDRAVRLAPLLNAETEVERWARTRDEIRDTIIEQGWNADLETFTGAFGSDHLDASVLILPLVGFLDATDSRMRSTIAAIEHRLLKDGLVYRWDGDTNGFVLCTYWLVECLALAGDVERAAELFDAVTARANDLGLLAEQIDPETGEQTGNFPQAFSHVGLINAAWRLATLTDHPQEGNEP